MSNVRHLLDATMLLCTTPFSPVVGIDSASDVSNISYTEHGLTVVVACQARAERVAGLEVFFAEPSGFRLLDEVDLARYWVSSSFSRGAYVIEVSLGGWSDEEGQLQGYAQRRREWIVVTGNACVNVFCSSEPEVRSIELAGV